MAKGMSRVARSFRLARNVDVDLPHLGTNRAIQHGAQRQHRALQCCIGYVGVGSAACIAVRDIPRDTTLANSLSPSKTGTTSPDWPATTSLAVNSPPGPLGLTVTLGAHLRQSIGRALLCRERLALSRPRPASSAEGRRSRQSAHAAARCAFSVHYWPPFQLAGRGHDQDRHQGTFC